MLGLSHVAFAQVKAQPELSAPHAELRQLQTKVDRAVHERDAARDQLKSLEKIVASKTGESDE
jgi:hypothetical protein